MFKLNTFLVSMFHLQKGHKLYALREEDKSYLVE